MAYFSPLTAKNKDWNGDSMVDVILLLFTGYGAKTNVCPYFKSSWLGESQGIGGRTLEMWAKFIFEKKSLFNFKHYLNSILIYLIESTK